MALPFRTGGCRCRAGAGWKTSLPLQCKSPAPANKLQSACMQSSWAHRSLACSRSACPAHPPTHSELAQRLVCTLVYGEPPRVQVGAEGVWEVSFHDNCGRGMHAQGHKGGVAHGAGAVLQCRVGQETCAWNPGSVSAEAWNLVIGSTDCSVRRAGCCSATPGPGVSRRTRIKAALPDEQTGNVAAGAVKLLRSGHSMGMGIGYCTGQGACPLGVGVNSQLPIPLAHKSACATALLQPPACRPPGCHGWLRR